MCYSLSVKFTRVLLFTVFIFSICAKASALKIQKSDSRIIGVTANDKFSYGLSKNKDDQLTATAELHFILPYFFFDIYDNSITNRGYKTKQSDPLTFSNGRYDELIVKAGTNINIFNTPTFDFIFTPQAGFLILGNFGMEFAQNLNHQMSCVDEVILEYEHFEKPFAPVVNATASFSYKYSDFLKLQLDLHTDNAIFYTTSQSIRANAMLGKKSLFNAFAGYTWNQTHNNSPSLKAYKNETTGFNYGFNLDTGLIKLDYITYGQSRNGIGSICMDFLNFKNHNWEQTDLSLYSGLSFLINTEFLETQLESKIYKNLSVYLNNKYVSGFKTNKVNPSEYRFERDYTITTVGLKYEQPLAFLQNWITPYVELGTGAASFGIEKLAYHIQNENRYSYKYDTKTFWHLEANLGLDIIPQGFLNYGNAAYSFTVFAGTIFIPEHAKATKQIKHDTYRTDAWKLNAFEFKFGFAVHMGLDF